MLVNWQENIKMYCYIRGFYSIGQVCLKQVSGTAYSCTARSNIMYILVLKRPNSLSSCQCLAAVHMGRSFQSLRSRWCLVTIKVHMRSWLEIISLFVVVERWIWNGNLQFLPNRVNFSLNTHFSFELH